MKAIFKSAVHMLIMDGNKILIQKRKGSKLWPGYYALPAGHIDEGENQYDALVREAKEELNIEINPNDILKEYKRYGLFPVYFTYRATTGVACVTYRFGLLNRLKLIAESVLPHFFSTRLGIDVWQRLAMSFYILQKC